MQKISEISGAYVFRSQQNVKLRLIVTLHQNIKSVLLCFDVQIYWILVTLKPLILLVTDSKGRGVGCQGNSSIFRLDFQ
jgi:hypothetical protein